MWRGSRVQVFAAAVQQGNAACVGAHHGQHIGQRRFQHLVQVERLAEGGGNLVQGGQLAHALLLTCEELGIGHGYRRLRGQRAHPFLVFLGKGLIVAFVDHFEHTDDARIGL